MTGKTYSVYNIMDIPVAAITMKEAVDTCIAMQEEPGAHIVATANAEMIMRAQSDKDLAHILQRADLVVPDGAGVLWAGDTLGIKFPERVTGCDLSECLLKEASERDWPVYFLGGAVGVAEEAAHCFMRQHKPFKLAGAHDGYFDSQEEKRIIHAIKESGTRLLLVGMGVPKQEKWLYQHREELGDLVAIGVGGVFNVMAGHLPRAPLWMQKHRLEWLYRLYLEPSRIGRMMALPRFMMAVKKWKKTQR